MNKKIALITAAAAILLLGSTRSWAVWRPQAISTVTATVTTGGTPSASFTLALKDVVNPATVRPNVSWAGALPNSTWKIADTMLEIQWSVTDVNGGIQIYTDNTNQTMTPIASPYFVDATPGDNASDPNGHNLDSNPAGLLQVFTGLSSSTVALPLAWSIKTSTMVVGLDNAARGILPADPNGTVEIGAGNKYQWLYMKDKATPALDLDGDGSWTGSADGTPFANAESFVTMIKSSGIHGAQGPANFYADPDRKSYVYLQGDFTTANAQTTYRTTGLKVEAFLQ